MRRGARVSQEALAREAGLSNTTISRWERGKEKEPETTSVRAVAEIFGVREEWLLTGREPRSATVNRANAPGEVLADLRTAIDAARHYIEELESALATRTPGTLIPEQAEALLVEATDAESRGEPPSGRERPA